MMMSILKRSVLVFCCLFICLSSFLFSASAVDSDTILIHFDISEPMTSDNAGYIVLLYQNPSGSSTPYSACVSTWFCSPYYDDPNTEESINTFANVIFSNSTSTSTKTEISIGSGASSSVSGFVVGTYQKWSSRINSDNLESGSPQVNYHFITSAESVDITVGTTGRKLIGYYYKGNVTMCVGSVYGSPRQEFTILWGDDSVEYQQVLDINNHFVSMLQKMDLSNEQLLECVSLLNDIYAECAATSSSLADFVYYYWEQFANFDLPMLFGNVTSRLDAIYRLLNKQGTVEQTTVDSSKVDEYADIEQSLVQNEDADNAIGDMNVSIDGQAYSFIWDLITDILNTHPEVFGLVITILTLGFLALILNR